MEQKLISSDNSYKLLWDCLHNTKSCRDKYSVVGASFTDFNIHCGFIIIMPSNVIACIAVLSVDET